MDGGAEYQVRVESEHQIWNRELIRKYHESHRHIRNACITYQGLSLSTHTPKQGIVE